jgi:electron transport complex protein RnfE
MNVVREKQEAKGKPLAKGNGCLSGECSSCSLSSTCGGKTLSSETEDPLVKKAVENLQAKQNTTEEVKA